VTRPERRDRDRLQELEALMALPGFWDRGNARELSREHADLSRRMVRRRSQRQERRA
jgi:hypothetical protein